MYVSLSLNKRLKFWKQAYTYENQVVEYIHTILLLSYINAAL